MNLSQYDITKISLSVPDQGEFNWRAVLEVQWDNIAMGMGRRKRRRRIRSVCKELGLNPDYQTRYDNVIDATLVYITDPGDVAMLRLSV